MSITFGKDLFSAFTITYNGRTHNAYVLGMEGLTETDFTPIVGIIEGIQYDIQDLSKGGKFSNPGIVDAEKSFYDEEDDNLCWAASAANMLAWSGWGELVLDVTAADPEDAIFKCFISNFYNRGYWQGRGLNWFFNGEGERDYVVYANSGNFFGLCPTITYAAQDPKLSGLKDMLDSRQCVGMVYRTDASGSSGHAVTIFGCTTDPTKNKEEAGYYTGLFITDSDDNIFWDVLGTGNTDTLRYIPVQWDAKSNQYFLEDFLTSTDADKIIGRRYEIDYIAAIPNYRKHTVEVKEKEVIANEYIFNGEQSVYGQASSIGLMKNAKQIVCSGGMVSKCEIGNSATQVIRNGGVANSGNIGGAGSQIIESGGTAINFSIRGELKAEGTQIISSGATASNTSINYNGKQLIEGTAFKNTLFQSGTEIILKGGLSLETYMSGGIQTISSGGTASSACMAGFSYFAKSQVISAGGLALDTRITNGSQIISSGGLSLETKILNDTQIISSGGIASSTTLSGSGLNASASQIIFQGGLASKTNITSGTQIISSGGIASSTTLTKAAWQTVLSGATADDTDISSDTSQLIYDGSALNTRIFFYGSQVISGGSATQTSIYGTQIIKRGAVISATIYNWGSQIISRGIVNNVTISGGLQKIMGGAVYDTTISEYGGRQLIFGGSAIRTTINGGLQIIDLGGSALFTTLSKGRTIFSTGAYASNFNVLSGGSLTIEAGVIGSGLNLDARAVVNCNAGATITGSYTDAQPGYEKFNISSGIAQDFYVGESSVFTVSCNQKSVNTLVSGKMYVTGGLCESANVANTGSQIISEDGITHNARIFGYQLIAQGGIASNTVINSNAIMSIEAGGNAFNATINTGGVQNVYGTATGGVVSGTQNIYANGQAVAVNLSNGNQNIDKDAQANDTIINTGASQIVSQGGTASSSIVNESAMMVIKTGGNAFNATINTGGVQNVYGTATGGVVSGTQNIYANGHAISANLNGGTQKIYAYGVALDTVLNSGGSQIILSQGSAENIRINKGAVQIVSSGGSALNITVASGGIQSALAGSWINGGTILAGGSHYAASGSVVSGLVIDGNALITSEGLKQPAASSAIADSGGGSGIAGSSGTGGSVNSGGSIIASSGGIDTPIISGGASIITSSSGTDSSVGSGGSVMASSGGIITPSISGGASVIASSSGTGGNVSSGGSVIVSSGGIITPSISGGASVITSSSGTGNSVGSGGTVITSSGGIDTPVISGGTSDIISSSGTGIITKPGTSSPTIATVGKGAIVADTILQGNATQHVLADGKALRTIINNGAKQNVYGLASATVINKGGTQIIYKNGTGLKDKVYGSQIISTGGKTISTFIKSGGAQYVRAGIASSSIISNGGEQYISASGLARGGVIYAGGKQFVYAKATVSNIRIMAGASQILRGGTIKGATCSSGATLIVSSGTASSTRLTAGGKAFVYKGGRLQSVTVEAKSLLSANEGVVISQMTLAKGGTLKVSGSVGLYANNTVNNATGTGLIKLARGASLSLVQNAAFKGMSIDGSYGQVLVKGIGNVVKSLASVKASNMVFDISNVDAASKTVMLGAQIRQSLKGSFSINTASQQKTGTYELASKLVPASNTAFTINIAGMKAGFVKVNGSVLNKNGVSYSLTTSGNQLNLKLAAIPGKMLRRTSGNGVLTGGANCDIFYGGAANDIIKGMNGRDVAIYDKNAWGKDIIMPTAGTITIIFSGIAKKLIRQKMSGKDMIFTRNDSRNQSITVKNWNSATHKIIYGGTLTSFSKYVAAPKSNASIQTTARNEVWKKAGLLA